MLALVRPDILCKAPQKGEAPLKLHVSTENAFTAVSQVIPKT